MKPLATILCLAAALALVSQAGAEQTYGDPTGDANGAPDITSVVVSNDNAGLITFRIVTTVAPGESEGFLMGIDADKNPGTGMSGWEYLLIDGSLFGHASGSAIVFDYPPPASLRETRSGTTTEISISRADLGNTSGLGFQIASFGGGEQGDQAPDVGWFTHDLAFPQCSNAKDDDGDGKIDSQDPGCSSPTDDDESDDPVTIKLGKAKTVPARPKAGRTAVVSASTTRVETGQPLDAGTVTCVGRIVGGKALKGTGSLVAGRAQCKVKLPATAKNKTVRGRIAVSYETATAKSSFTFRTAA